MQIWDDGLARQAQKWAERCIAAATGNPHNPNAEGGENIAWGGDGRYGIKVNYSIPVTVT